MNILCDSIYRKFKKKQNQSRALEVRVVTTLGGDSDWKGDKTGADHMVVFNL